MPLVKNNKVRYIPTWHSQNLVNENLVNENLVNGVYSYVGRKKEKKTNKVLMP
jgi:hypothetical protein